MSARETQVAADAMNVGVDWNQQLGRRDGPESEVHSVGGPNHPSCVEQQAFARAACPWIADQMPQIAVRRFAAERSGEPRQTFAEVATARSVELNEGIAEGFVLADQPPRSP